MPTLEPEHLFALGALVATTAALLLLVAIGAVLFVWARSWAARFERVLLERRDDAVRIEASLAEPPEPGRADP